jgi:hypothetical protein|tara:strand:+ start:460 stop:834 length:375 start_codon:yes stop_codon:yes gene_type:complete
MANFDMTRPATNKAIYAVAATLAYKFIGENDLKRFEFNKLKARFGAVIKSVHDGEPLAGDINKLFNVKKITAKNSAAAKYLKVLKTEDLKPNQEAPITAKGKVSKNFKTSSAPRIATAADLGMI